MSVKIIKQTTYGIDLQFKLVNNLKSFRSSLGSTLFRRTSTSDVIQYVSALSKAEADLWAQVRTLYPESVGKKSVTISSTEVSWEEDETPPTTEELLELGKKEV